jgi:hypothetical protein
MQILIKYTVDADFDTGRLSNSILTCSVPSSPRSKMEMGNKTAEVEELLNTVSCMRDQQTYLLRALKECTAIISSEMTQTQQRWKGYNARHDEAGSARFCTRRQRRR